MDHQISRLVWIIKGSVNKKRQNAIKAKDFKYKENILFNSTFF